MCSTIPRLASRDTVASVPFLFYKKSSMIKQKEGTAEMPTHMRNLKDEGG
jgi:hypothetical protein